MSEESQALIMETIESVSHGNDLNEHKSDLMENSNSYLSDVTNQQQNDTDDDAVDRLQIDFDPPKPEPKKKQRKPKQTKGSEMADAAAALAAENKMDNIFGNHLHDSSDTDTENKDVSDINRDSVSENELDSSACSKNEDLLFIDREDQRHDSDLLSPDERSNEDIAATDTVKKKRGRKPKNSKESNAGQKMSSPRGTRILSPRSPRSSDPRSPKYEAPSPLVKSNDTKGRRGKGLLEDGDMKEILNEETGEIKLSSIENIKNKLNFSDAGKNSQKFSNIFDFDENDESITIKQQRQRRKKGNSLQSPENRGIFSSPERNQVILSDDKQGIRSPESKMLFSSPEPKISFGLLDKKGIDMEKKLEIDLKPGLFSPLGGQVETQKMEVKAVLEEKDPEPLFKAFFEAKSKSGKADNDKSLTLAVNRRPSGPQNEPKELKIDTSKEDQDKLKNLVSPPGLMSPIDKTKSLMSPPTSVQSMSNVDKTIDNVSKGLFEGSTDDEAEAGVSGLKKKALKKGRDEKKDQPSFGSPLPSSLSQPSVTTATGKHVYWYLNYSTFILLT